LLGLIGRKTRKALAEAGDFLALLSVLFRARFYTAHRSRRRIFYKVSSRQVYLTAVMALPVNALIALLLGFALVFNLPANTGGEQLVPLFSELFVIVIMRELARVMCAILIVVRSGTAATAKLGYLAIIAMKCLVSGLLIGLYAIRYGASMQGHVAKVARSISTSGTRQLVSVLVANVAISLLASTP